MKSKQSSSWLFTFAGYMFAFIAIVATASDAFTVAKFVLDGLGLSAITLGVSITFAALVALFFMYQEGSSLVKYLQNLEHWLRGYKPLPEDGKAEAPEADVDQEAQKEKSQQPIDKKSKAVIGSGLVFTIMAVIFVGAIWGVASYYGVNALLASASGLGSMAPWIIALSTLAAVAQFATCFCQEGMNFIRKLIDNLKALLARIVKVFSRTATTATKTAPVTLRRRFFTFLGYLFALIAIVATASDTFMVAKLVFDGLGFSTITLPISIVFTVLVSLFFMYQEGNSLVTGFQTMEGWLAGSKPKLQESTIKDAATEKTVVENKVTDTQPAASAKGNSIAVRASWVITVSLVVFVAIIWGISTYYGAGELLMGAINLSAAAPWIIGLSVLAALAQFATCFCQEGMNFARKVVAKTAQLTSSLPPKALDALQPSTDLSAVLGPNKGGIAALAPPPPDGGREERHDSVARGDAAGDAARDALTPTHRSSPPTLFATPDQLASLGRAVSLRSPLPAQGLPNEGSSTTSSAALPDPLTAVPAN